MEPPCNFGLVAAGVYRSEAPLPHCFNYLASLKFKTCIYLSAESLQKPFRQFLETNGIELSHIGRKTWSLEAGWRAVNNSLVKAALEQILDCSTHPVLVTCAYGVHETGAVIACLRRRQRWSITACIDEYRRYAGSKARLSDEQFFESFDSDLVYPAPSRLPSWARCFIEEETVSDEAETQPFRDNALFGVRGPFSLPPPLSTRALAFAYLPPARQPHQAPLSPASDDERKTAGFDKKDDFAPSNSSFLSLASSHMNLVSSSATFNSKLSLIDDEDD